MRDNLASSTILGAIISFLILLALGLAFEGTLSNKITFIDPNTSVDDWRRRYQLALALSSVTVALLSFIWLWQAHRGHGLDSKAGTWVTLLAISVLFSIGLFWFYASDLKEGFGLQILVVGIASLLGYWVATLLTTPKHYQFTPWLAAVFLGRKGRQR